LGPSANSLANLPISKFPALVKSGNWEHVDWFWTG